MKKAKLLRNFLIGAGLALALESTGVYDYIAQKFINGYDNIKTTIQAKSGTAYLGITDTDGLDSVILQNDTSKENQLTQIPTLSLHNFYANRFVVALPNLKQGLYHFKAQIKDDKGNIEEKVFEIDIKNINIGLDSLYRTPATIDNKRLPTGKENFEL